jgi:hypothetical protein
MALNALFEAGATGGEELTNAQVADAINARAGEQVLSDETLRRLRKPGAPQPAWKKIQAIADFFGVQTDYFRHGSAAARGIDHELAMLKKKREEQAPREEQEHQEILALARSARGLDANSRELVRTFIRGLQKRSRDA